MICDEGLEGDSAREVENDGLLTALRKRDGVEAPLLDLMDTLQAETKMGPGSQIARRV